MILLQFSLLFPRVVLINLDHGFNIHTTTYVLYYGCMYIKYMNIIVHNYHYNLKYVNCTIIIFIMVGVYYLYYMCHICLTIYLKLILAVPT